MQPIYSHSATLIIPAHLAPQDDEIVSYFRHNRKQMLITEFSILHNLFLRPDADFFTLHFHFTDEKEQLYFEKDSECMTYLYSILKQGKLKVKRFKRKAVIDIEYVYPEDYLSYC